MRKRARYAINNCDGIILILSKMNMFWRNKLDMWYSVVFLFHVVVNSRKCKLCKQIYNIYHIMILVQSFKICNFKFKTQTLLLLKSNVFV